VVRSGVRMPMGIGQSPNFLVVSQFEIWG
jgi:hypothetical protein